MPAQYFNQNTDISSLQWKILKYIATHDNSDYKGIANELGRKRTTIFESVKPLKKGYIEAIKEDHALRNSRVIFRLTREGKDYLARKKYFDDTPISNYDILLSETDLIVLSRLFANSEKSKRF
jgi:DNA-binding MarR family transcriptional regulator